jgi:hypothetical protein
MPEFIHFIFGIVTVDQHFLEPAAIVETASTSRLTKLIARISRIKLELKLSVLMRSGWHAVCGTCLVWMGLIMISTSRLRYR